MSDEQKCPKCATECYRDSADVGVGIIYGPWGCPGCGWSEDEKYDLSTGRSAIDEKGGAIDQYGGYHPPKSLTALATRLAENPDAKIPYKLADSTDDIFNEEGD